MPKWNDKNILAAIRQGGREREEAIQQFLQQHLGYVGKMIAKFKLPETEVLDAYTDACLITVEHVKNGRFAEKSKLSTYFYQVLFNRCRDLTKKKSTKVISLEEWASTWEPSSKDQLEALLLQEDFTTLRTHLDKLGHPCKQILLDWGYWGYSMQEIAERVGLVSADQAKRKKYKCQQKLLANFPIHE